MLVLVKLQRPFPLRKMLLPTLSVLSKIAMRAGVASFCKPRAAATAAARPEAPPPIMAMSHTVAPAARGGETLSAALHATLRAACLRTTTGIILRALRAFRALRALAPKRIGAK